MYFMTTYVKKKTPQKLILCIYYGIAKQPSKDTCQIIVEVISWFLVGERIEEVQGTSSIFVILYILGK